MTDSFPGPSGRKTRRRPVAALLAGLVLLAAVGRGPALAEPSPHLRADPKASLAAAFPPRQDWSADKLARARDLAVRIGSTAVIVVHDGGLVAEWGQTTKRTSSHSVRKSLLSALYGLAIQRGLIDPAATLADLGIDDLEPLSQEEKKATVRDLLMSRSGVYHPAASESAAMKAARPARRSHPPGTFWYYNNWDFNVLGTIFVKRTGLAIGRAFQDWIAEPIGMQDFRAEDVRLSREAASSHAAYPFYVSARDLARFGVLYLEDGVWRGRRILPPGWVAESTAAYSRQGDFGYGYMWWIYRNEAYFASGFGGQFVLVAPEQRLVVVNRVDTGEPGAERREWFRRGDKVDGREFQSLVQAILEAAPDKPQEAGSPKNLLTER